MAIASGASPQGVALDHQAGSLSNRRNVQQVQGNNLYGECSDMSLHYYLSSPRQNVNYVVGCVRLGIGETNSCSVDFHKAVCLCLCLQDPS